MNRKLEISRELEFTIVKSLGGDLFFGPMQMRKAAVFTPKPISRSQPM
jgi:hypothetical protein